MLTTMIRTRALSFSFAAITLALVPSLAHAQQQQPQQNCPPGSWFCADAQAQGSTGAQTGQTGQQNLQQLPPPGQTQAQGAPPPVVVYQPPPPVVVVQQPREQP